MSRADLATLWRSLPEELIDKVFATMPVDSLAACRLVCRDWNSRIKSPNFLRIYRDTPPRDDPWFMCSSYNCRDSCYAFSPSLSRWFNLSLAFLPAYMRFPLASIGGLIFLIAGLSSFSTLAVCNPVSRTWKELPQMTYKRYNPLVGVYQEQASSSNQYKIVVAGGTSECGGDYECSAEVYDSATNTWTVLGGIPRSYTVKITLWTSKSVFCKGTLYCLTSARPYNLMACHLETRVWVELKVPQPACLYSSFLLERNQRLLLLGGVGTDRVCERIHIWELELENQQWLEKEQMPQAYFDVLFKSGKSDHDLKFTGSGDLIYMFKSSHSGVLVCDLSTKPTSWSWLPHSPLTSHSNRFPVKGMFINPRLDSCCV